MKKKRILTESERRQIIDDKQKNILESFATNFNRIKRIDEQPISENLKEIEFYDDTEIDDSEWSRDDGEAAWRKPEDDIDFGEISKYGGLNQSPIDDRKTSPDNRRDDSPLFENDSDTYFKTLASALDYVRNEVTKMGYELDEDDMWSSFGTGGVGYGETKRGTITLLKDGKPLLSKRGKPLNRAIQIVIYRMDSGTYELTWYKTW